MNELPVQKRKAILLILILLSLALALGWIKRIIGPATDSILDLDSQIPKSFNIPSDVDKNSIRESISINSADVQTLSLLNGIGPVKAARIIEYRKANGKFNELNELINVKGIGLKTFEKIKNNISL